MDRATRPRFWLHALPADPSLPIRGRYVSLRVEVPLRPICLGVKNNGRLKPMRF